MNGCASCRAVWPAGVDSGSRSAALSAALRQNPATVTEWLEHLAGEPIDADIRHQAIDPAPEHDPLGRAPDAPTLHRAVLLTGRVTGLAFVYAESVIAADRLPASVSARLQASRDPIGRVLLDHRLVLGRHPVSGTVVATHADPDVTGLLVDAVLSRRYRIVIDDDPVMIVSEWFLETVPIALSAHLRAPVTPEAEG